MADGDKGAIFLQTSLAMAALTVAFAKTLEELFEPAEPILILQRKVQGEQTRLRQSPGADEAVAMFRFVIDALRNPDVIEQSKD